MRHRMAMVNVPELFRVKLTLSGPEGERHVWYEGPYPADTPLSQRISYWNGYYRDTRGEGWSVTGGYEKAEIDWKPFSAA